MSGTLPSLELPTPVTLGLAGAPTPNTPTARRRVAILGAGVSGLTTAYRLHRLTEGQSDAPEIVVLEARDRPGGAIWTEERDGFRIEGGADAFITNKPWALDLCHELGLGDRLLSTSDRHRRSFVVRQGRLLPVPEGFVLMAPGRLMPLALTPILSIRAKLRLLLDLVLPRKVDDTDESLASFVRRRLGREVLERLVQPLVGGIYTADPADLSLKATLPQFVAMEREHGSLIRAATRQARRDRSKSADTNASGARYGLFVTPEAGMAALPRSLVQALPAGTVRTSTAARRVVRTESPAPRWRVELLDGPPLEADAVVLAVEAHASARLVDALDPDLALHLRSIPYASSAIVTLAYRRDQVAHPLDGFGAVVPRLENRQILAISFTSVKFPHRAPPGSVLLRVFVGGATQSELFDLDDEAIEAIARRESAELLGIRGEPLFGIVARHSRAMPQYTLGHMDRVASIRERIAAHPGLILAGNAYDGVGVPDAVRSGERAAQSVRAVLAVESV